MEIVVYKRLINIQDVLKVSLVGEWDEDLRALSVSDIHALIGIWRVPNSKRVYVLQKHPGLEMISPEKAEAEIDDE